MNKLTFLLVLFFAGGLVGMRANAGDWKTQAEDPSYIHRSIKTITDVIVHDIFSPPVASRIYAYVTVAGYEAALQGDTAYLGLEGQLHELGRVVNPDAGKQYCFSLAAVQAILLVGKSLVISEGAVDNFREKVLGEIRATGIPLQIYANSLDYGKKIAEHILAWAARDHYKETRSYPRYDVNDETGNWKPTPPAYMKAIEPHWSEMRTFVLDSATQFVPHPPTPYSTEKNSPFYQEALEVYSIGGNLTAEQQEIANFWDCNPFKMNVNGHVMYATKKISPGGHWINITAVACRRAHADYIRSVAAYASVSIVIADAFISCWDEKYRSKAVRPETYINQYINAQWMPLLQTPPFPEYTSGHSVVSACAATILTRLFGENVEFADSTEMEFGIPARHFASFHAAADEAAISRFYGGIHFMPAIRYGLEEGYRIGSFVAGSIRTRRRDMF
jgi:hypothetical protein